MRYLIQPKDSEPFLTNWYDEANHYIDGMIVYDLKSYEYTEDGFT